MLIRERSKQTMSSQASDSGGPPAAVGHGAFNLSEGIGVDDADRRAEDDIDEARPVLAADPEELALGAEPAEAQRAQADTEAGRAGGA
jgi:hypothetical protein